MKKYKLLKDLPFAKAGEILELWSDGTMSFKDNPSLPRFRKGDVEWFPLWFERLDESKFYYLIDNIGDVREATEEEVERFEKRKAIGNYFKTREEAEKHLKWLKARAVLLGDVKPNDGYKHEYEVYVDLKHGTLHVAETDWTVSSEIRFSSKEDAESSIDKHEKEWKIYLGVE